MTKTILKFDDLDKDDREWILKETWCYTCQKPDLGIVDPILYRESEKLMVEGKCIVCAEPQISQIITKLSNA